MRELFDDQQNAIDNLRTSVAQGVRRIVLMSPTGSGKTIVASEIGQRARRKNKRLAFVVSHLSLIDQVVEEFYADGMREISVLQADHRMTDWSKPIQICSVQTLQRRNAFPEADLVFIDECHVLHAHHKKWLTAQEWKNVPIIGLSATPWTKGLGRYFETLLIASTTQELIEKGRLSKFRCFATGHPDLHGVRVSHGDYVEKDLSQAMQAGSLTADIIETYKKRWGKGKTLCFAVDCDHAKVLHERFTEAGIRSRYQDAHTPLHVRKEFKQQFHSGEIDIIVNVGTLTIGADFDVRCLILARPTKSKILFVQIIGRALRTAPGKEDALILDHTETTEKLGFVTDIHIDHLDDGIKKEAEDKKPAKPLPKPCPKCDCLLPRVQGVCPNCGYEMPKLLSGIVERDGELIDVTSGKVKIKPGKAQPTIEEMRRFYGGLRYKQIEKDYKPGWADIVYKEKFGEFPALAVRDAPPVPPSIIVKQWIAHRMIVYRARQRKKAAMQQGLR